MPEKSGDKYGVNFNSAVNRFHLICSEEFPWKSPYMYKAEYFFR